MSEHGRRERGRVIGRAGIFGRDEGFEGPHAGFRVRVAGVGVGCVGRFEAEADGFAAAGEGGPVEEFVGGGGGGGGGFLAFGGGGGGGWHGGLFMGWEAGEEVVVVVVVKGLGCEVYFVVGLLEK